MSKYVVVVVVIKREEDDEKNWPSLYLDVWMFIFKQFEAEWRKRRNSLRINRENTFPLTAWCGSECCCYCQCIRNPTALSPPAISTCYSERASESLRCWVVPAGAGLWQGMGA